MSKETLIKAALVALLVGTALVSERTGSSWFTFGVVAFGAFNVLVSAPGTQLVRVLAVVTALTVLVSSSSLLVLLTWLLWPPAFTVAWAVARERSAASELDDRDRKGAATRARITLAAVILAVTIASLAYRLFVDHGIQQTAALFVGIPSVLAIVVVFTVSPRSATGVACKAVTVGLLVSLLFLGEGILCVVMSAPLFYGVAVGIAAAIDTARGRDQPIRLFSCLVFMAALPMSLEGVTRFTTLNREESVAETKSVLASPEAVARAMFEPPRFDRVRPLYLRAGFPRAVSTHIEHASDGMRWVIQLRGGEMHLNGIEPRTGDLILALEEARPGLVRWRAVSDSSHVTHFLTWREVIVQWAPVGAGETRVTWTLRYRRDLDPAWYFGPWERYAVRLAAGYLIDSVATP